MGDFNRGSKRGSGRRGSGRRDSGRGFDRGPRRGGFGGPKQMHKAVCAECGQECEVPFKPTGDRPVYCKECFRKKKGF
jgi:CxxC-x17-CxxC domain-containing protein